MKLGTRGISVLFASGDNGVGCNLECSKFEPDFPSSPYVTLVGSTALVSKSGEEVGATFSAGGFSNTWGRTDYQEEAVEKYLQGKNLPPSHFYNASGRGYPDLATTGVNVQIVIHGRITPVDGTSCSAPTLSGMIALLNDLRLSSGKKTLGFLNPLLYQWAQNSSKAYNDITSGKNPDRCCPGFNAAPGWDPVTGLGTPNFATWLSLLTKLP